jgi:dihydrofolate synthase / folylpolyglutamate synthase
MSYPDSVRYLYALGNELKVGAKFGLDRMERLLEELGHPEAGQRFVHVAGTNGKGSTCAAIRAVLQAGGLRTGLYTSPHLQEPTERIQIGGEPVSPERFAEAFEPVHAAAERALKRGSIDAHPSYFETVTAMAFLVFQNECDVSVIEVGLGGRLDATNVIQPELTVITPISFDHEAYLGNTLELIAGEKAGIIKRGIPVVIAGQVEPVREVLLERARELASPAVLCDQLRLGNIESTSGGCKFDLDGQPFFFSLAGEHQAENGRTAISACRALGIEDEQIRQGLERVRWPGRLEQISERPDFILDGAHNPAGAEALARHIERVYRGREIWLVYGAMRDKAIDEVIGRLFPLATHVILTAPHVPRALRPEAIADMTEHSRVSIEPELAGAVERARQAPADAAVFFTGSLFLVGEARALLREGGHVK